MNRAVVTVELDFFRSSVSQWFSWLAGVSGRLVSGCVRQRCGSMPRRRHRRPCVGSCRDCSVGTRASNRVPATIVSRPAAAPAIFYACCCRRGWTNDSALAPPRTRDLSRCASSVREAKGDGSTATGVRSARRPPGNPRRRSGCFPAEPYPPRGCRECGTDISGRGVPGRKINTLT